MGGATKKQVDELADRYIRQLLLHMKSAIQPEEITPELIELKRQQVQLKRSLKRMKNTKKEV
jgi:hypothetical protein